MEEYYGGYGRRATGAGGSLVLRIVDLAMSVVTFATAVAMCLTFITPYVEPSTAWFFALLGLAAPAVYLATVLVALYWIIRWRWGRASCMLLLVAAGAFRVSLFYKPELRRSYGEPEFGRNTVTMMSYNVRAFFGDDGQCSASSVAELIRTYDPDIVCLQEYNAALAASDGAFEPLLAEYASAMGIRRADLSSCAEAPLVIMSKYRILDTGTTLGRDNAGEERLGVAIWADLLIGEDTVRVFNNHLRSTAINADDNDFITNHRYLSDSTREARIRSIVRRVRDNSVLRAGQVDSIAVEIEATGYAKIVCGDFNDTPVSYVYRRMADGLNDAFREAGRGYSYTYRGFFNMLRIDFVLLSDDFETLFYEVPETPGSDHLPVVVRMKYNKRH